MSNHLTAYWHSLEPDVKDVIESMDSHEGLGHGPDNELTDQMTQMLSESYGHIESIAQSLGPQSELEQHIETLMLIVAYSPNPQTYSFVNKLVDEQPGVYQHLYNMVVGQKPLQMSGKLLRERIMFYIEMEQLVHVVFSPESLGYVERSLEAYPRV